MILHFTNLFDLRIIIGIAIGVAITVAVVAIIISWRRGRAIRSGKKGERMVAKELATLKRKHNIVINDLMLPTSNGRTSQVDHVVVSTRGIFVIETKNHAGRIAGYEHAQYWQQHLQSQSRSFYNPLLQNRSHLRAIRRLLPKLDADLFTTIVVFTTAWRLEIKADDIIKPRKFLADRHIRRTLVPEEWVKKKWWTPWKKEVVLDEHKIVTRIDGLLYELKRRPRIIDKGDLAGIAEKLIAANVEDKAIRKQHTNYAKETSRSVASDISKGKCPRCGAPLTIRKGEKGEFGGCTRYPACRFTCSIDRLHP